MKNNLLITLEYPPQHGGIARYLKAEVDASADTITVAGADSMFWDKWPQWLPVLWKLRKQIATSDMLWVSHILPIGYIALAYKKIFNKPYRIYLHGLDLIRPKKFLWKKYWVRKILLNAEEIIANSNATAGLLAQYNIPATRARIQHPRVSVVDTKKYFSRAESIREKFGIKKKPLLLSVSRLVKRKGINLALRALPAIWREIPDLVYVIVGDGEERLSLESYAKSLEKRQIFFTGPSDDEEMYSWMAACDCFILTPINDPDDFEGYGIVYKEAQQFGKPVIASRVGGVPEAVGKHGILVDPGDVSAIARAVVAQIQKSA